MYCNWSTPIYVVYVCQKLSFRSPISPTPKEPVKPVRWMWLDGEHMMGFFYEKEAAIQMVKDNAQDMYESCFPYALVEEVFPGLGCFRAEQRWAFKIDLKTRKYVEIEIPKYVTETMKMD